MKWNGICDFFGGHKWKYLGYVPVSHLKRRSTKYAYLVVEPSEHCKCCVLWIKIHELERFCAVIRGVTSFASFVRLFYRLLVCLLARSFACAFLFGSNFATSIYICIYHRVWPKQMSKQCVCVCVSASQKTKLNAKIIIKQAYHEFSNCAVNYDHNLL